MGLQKEHWTRSQKAWSIKHEPASKPWANVFCAFSVKQMVWALHAPSSSKIICICLVQSHPTPLGKSLSKLLKIYDYLSFCNTAFRNLLGYLFLGLFASNVKWFFSMFSKTLSCCNIRLRFSLSISCESTEQLVGILLLTTVSRSLYAVAFEMCVRMSSCPLLLLSRSPRSPLSCFADRSVHWAQS